MKSNPDFAAISAVLKENLDLVGSPVAVKIVTAPEQIPAGVPEIEETCKAPVRRRCLGSWSSCEGCDTEVR